MGLAGVRTKELKQDATRCEVSPLGENLGRNQFSLQALMVVVLGVCLSVMSYVPMGLFGASGLLMITALVLRYRYLTSRRSKWLSWLLLAPSILGLKISLVGWAFFDYGPIMSNHSWPDGLRRMIKVAPGDTRFIRVVGRGVFLDSEHVWCMHIDQLDVAKLEAEFGMSEIPKDRVPASFWRVFPLWWRLAYKEEMIFLSTPDFPAPQRGFDGTHFFAVYERETKYLYVWHKFHF